MNWSTASFIAHIDKVILTHGYDCDVELVPGDTVPTGTSMTEKGEPDIAPELWTNSFEKLLAKSVQEKRLRIIGKPLSDGGEEGFWVPQYMVEKFPELASIEGVKKHSKLFKHPESPKKSAFVGCPSGWSCQISSENLFNALKLSDAGFEIIDPGSAAALDGSITKAYERKKPWFGYYWSPTAILGKYKMVKVDFGSGIDQKHFNECISQKDCQNPKPTMYPASPIYTVVTERFAKASSSSLEYLKKRSFTNVKMNELLVWIDENQADGETAAIYFLKTFPSVWANWLPKDIEQKVLTAVKNK